jgi:ABC-2 type transport system permease protein
MTAISLTHSHKPRAATPTSAWRKLFVTETKLFVREPLALFWGLAFPLILIVVFGLTSLHAKPDPKLGHLRVVDVYVPVLMAFVLTILAMNVLPSVLATYREKGVLRRMSTTPMPAWKLLAADVAVNVTTIVAALATIALVGKLAFHVKLPSEALGYLLTLILAATAMLSIGALIGSLAKTTRIAGAAGTLLFFPMMFFAGLWVPQAEMGTTLKDIAHYTPLGATVPSIQATMAGHWPQTGHLVVLAAYAIVLAFAAVRLFRWE